MFDHPQLSATALPPWSAETRSDQRDSYCFVIKRFARVSVSTTAPFILTQRITKALRSERKSTKFLHTSREVPSLEVLLLLHINLSRAGITRDKGIHKRVSHSNRPRCMCHLRNGPGPSQGLPLCRLVSFWRLKRKCSNFNSCSDINCCQLRVRDFRN